MTQRAPLWVVGGGGLLGTSLRQQAASDFNVWDAPPIDWVSAHVGSQITAEAGRFLEFCGDSEWNIAWCAGAGVIGTSNEQLAAETDLLAAVLEATASAGEGSLFLSSSAGGVYGGSADLPITEHSEPAPLSPYGENKIRQERLVREWSARTGHRSVLGRIANLYGAGQSLQKSQGLISQVCLATLLRRPISIYVSLDTIRDYVYVDDCARQIVAALHRAKSLGPTDAVVKIFGSGRSISIGGVLAEARRVLGRKPTVAVASSPNRRMQGRALSFRSVVWPDLQSMEWTPLPVGISAVARSIQSKVAAGELG